MKFKNSKAFTLLEILLVVGIIAILAGIVIIAINPSKQLAQVRNTQRKSDLKQIANAITQFYIDKNYYPASSTFPTSSLMTICPTGASTSPAAGFNCTNMLNLSELVPTYLTAIPNDPGTTTTAGYSVVLVNKNPAVSAPLAELGTMIFVGDLPICDRSPAVGTVCNDGTIYVSSNLRTTPSNAGNYTWGIQGVTTNARDYSDGRNNLATLKLVDPDLSDYPAERACNNLTPNFGHNDWYLPSVDEAYMLFSNRSVIGGFDVSGNPPGSILQTSTEDPAGVRWQNFFWQGGQGYWAKYNLGAVRCVRRTQ